MSMPRRYLFTSAVLLTLLCSGSRFAFAEDDRGVLVQVRVIKGSQPIESGSLRKFEYDKRLEDLRPELTRLHYGSFSLLAAQKKVVRLAHRETIPLTDGETLTVRPHYMDAAKIGMWLRWVEKSGAPVLDTRLHLDSGKNILLEESREYSAMHPASRQEERALMGASVAPPSGTGMILAISVGPPETDN